MDTLTSLECLKGPNLCGICSNRYGHVTVARVTPHSCFLIARICILCTFFMRVLAKWPAEL